MRIRHYIVCLATLALSVSCTGAEQTDSENELQVPQICIFILLNIYLLLVEKL